MLGVRHSEILLLLSTVDGIVLRDLKCKNLSDTVVINQLEGN